MTPLQKLVKERHEKAERGRALRKLETRSDDQETELSGILERLETLDGEIRTEAILEGEPEQREVETETEEDAETRERRELRAKVSVGRYLAAGLLGEKLEGAEEEFRQALGAKERTIPLDAFEVDAERREAERRADAATPAPGTVGINMTGIVPSVFADSIAMRLGIGMPRVPSGQYSIPRLTTDLTAGAKGRGDDQESTAAAFTVIGSKPKRVSARLTLRAEDLAEVGIPGFEASLRQNLRMVLSDVVDVQLLRGDDAGDNINGLHTQITDGAAPGEVVTFASFVSDMADLIDGKWAQTLGELSLATNAAVYAKLAKTFQDPKLVSNGNPPADSVGAGAQSIETVADWGAMKLRGLWCNSNMEASVANVGASIAMRGRPAGMSGMAAVCPVWGDIGITDPYSDSASATGHYTLHVLLGDVLVRYPDCYREVRIKTA